MSPCAKKRASKIVNFFFLAVGLADYFCNIEHNLQKIGKCPVDWHWIFIYAAFIKEVICQSSQEKYFGLTNIYSCFLLSSKVSQKSKKIKRVPFCEESIICKHDVKNFEITTNTVCPGNNAYFLFWWRLQKIQRQPEDRGTKQVLSYKILFSHRVAKHRLCFLQVISTYIFRIGTTHIVRLSCASNDGDVLNRA